MKALLVCEYRDGKFLDASYELLAFAEQLGAESALLLVGTPEDLPNCDRVVYLADVARYGEYNPDLHKRLVLEAVEKENPDCIVFLHSSYGWDLAPRVAVALKAAQVSEIVAVTEGAYEVGCCNAKLRRTVAIKSPKAVLTIQAGAFTPQGVPQGVPRVTRLDVAHEAALLEFAGYEAAEEKSINLGKAEIIVSAGRGVGKKENIPLIAGLAKALGGELGASRPVVDAGWLDHGHQVGTTGQVVSPKLYVACGISGAIQHVAGMRKADFVVAINKDKDAPIGEVADVLVVADVMRFIPALVERMQ
jgi:electron transfer flavoprotein alpha subunit